VAEALRHPRSFDVNVESVLAALSFEETIETIGKVVDVMGVAVIVLGIVYVSVVLAGRALSGDRSEESYKRYRHGLGRAILLGLEILVAADIIRTVAVSPTFRSVGVLAIIVLVRTFLSFSLEVELEGSWPWQRKRNGAAAEKG
jgi:uncharacterized membrane protein